MADGSGAPGASTAHGAVDTAGTEGRAPSPATAPSEAAPETSGTGRTHGADGTDLNGTAPDSAQDADAATQTDPGAATRDTGTPHTTAPAPGGPPVSATGPRRPAPVQPASTPARPDPAPIAPVRPAKPVTARPVVRRSADEEALDGPPCPVCGTPNPPGRRFCRRCAAPLDPAATVEELPWWRKRWPFRRRVRAGSGDALRRTLLLLLVVALLVAGFYLLPFGRTAVEDVRDKLSGASAISPTDVSASAAVKGHPASAATDGLTNRYWGAPRTGESVTFTFRAPFRLVNLVVHTGASKSAQDFRKQARPTELDLLATDADGKTHRQKVTLNDKPGPQTVTTRLSDVVKVRLVPRTAAGEGAGRHLALGEVEFFKRG
ncbi:NADase-type glycan-binding domain-containing protein [Streptomyces sp. NPDC054796]